MSRSGYMYPGYHYLGPGNDIYSEEEVVNSTDFIAYIHDLEYTLASKTQDIREADKTAIASFIEDFKQNGRVADLAGIFGLGIKYGVESVFGVQYPSMSDKKLTFSQYLFAERERHLSVIWQAEKGTNNYVNYQAFKNSQTAKDLYKEYRSGGYYYKELHKRFHSPTDDQIIPDQEAGPSIKRKPSDTGLDDPGSTKQGRFEDNRAGTSKDTSENPFTPETTRFIEDSFANLDTGSTFEEASRASGGAEAATPMDVSESGTSRGPNTGARGGASGTNSSGGQSSSAISNLTWIRPSNPSTSNVSTFTKQRILISYGYSTENLQLGQPDYIENVTTPLALIPVDFLPFYLSNAEFQALPFGSKILEVECKVTPLGTRTAFDTGTTLSGTATSEYVPIGLVCEGLNVQFYGRNKEYRVDATNPMKPLGVKIIDPTEMGKRYYEHIGSNALCVPQVIDQYYVHEWNRNANPDINNLPAYQVHDYGVARMDEKVHQFLINQAIGQEIIHYKYKPKNGLIKSAKDHFVPWNRRSNAVETIITRPRSMALQFFNDENNKPIIGDVGLGIDKSAYTMINQLPEKYYRNIDNYGAFHPGKGATGFNAQPQLHVGIIATPQLNPATSSVSYLNSACYWKIECKCKIGFNLDSAFSINNVISWPLEVNFIQNKTPKYTDGQCLFGNTDTGSGNVAKHIEDEELDVDFDSDSEYIIIDKKTGLLKL